MRSRRRFAVGLLLVLVAAAVWLFWASLPSPLFSVPYSTLLLDRNGHLLGAHIASDGQWRFPPTQDISDKFAKALVAYEDKRFYLHPGVDPLALARAIRANLRAGHVVSGGSTITMQLARLARDNPPRTYGEKLIESLLALRIEAAYSKQEILALYAAHAPFGGNVVGLKAAAWRYFGRDAAELTWAEACTLAVLPNNPAIIHPGRHRAELKAKRDRLLERLQTEGVISATDAELARIEPLPGAPTPLPQAAPHLLDTLLQQGTTQTTLATTLDEGLQRQVQRLLNQHSKRLATQGIRNAAALVVDNRSFEVLAYVGNSDDDGDGQAVDVIQRPRSTGSLLKPLLFAAMLQGGELLPKTLVPDVPSNFRGYRPENFDRDYRGAVPAQEALVHSLNVPAVRMLQRYGVERFYDYLHQAGMSTLFRPPGDYGLSLILGGAEGTLWEMTALYANLAAIARSEAQAGTGHYRRLSPLVGGDTQTPRRTEIGAAAAWLTLNALKEVNRPGADSQWRRFADLRPVAWKTGTSYGERDGWAIGNTAHYTVGVWIGNATGEGRPGLTGYLTAAPLLFEIVNRLEDRDWFVQPTRLMRRVTSCRDDGYLADGLCDTEEQWMPIESHFEKVSPYHVRIHLDPAGAWRVDGSCQSVTQMQHRGWFVLPPAQEHYYRRSHPEYRTLPPWRADCRAALDQGRLDPIELLYPTEGARIYIPIELDGSVGGVVFEAVHRDTDGILYWHLDDSYLATTRTFHTRTLQIAPGHHTLTLVDEAGNRLERHFEVLSKEHTQ